MVNVSEHTNKITTILNLFTTNSTACTMFNFFVVVFFKQVFNFALAGPMSILDSTTEEMLGKEFSSVALFCREDEGASSSCCHPHGTEVHSVLHGI